MPEITSENISVSAFILNGIGVYLYMSGRERANGTYHRETGRHCESPREKGMKMIHALLPDPFSPAVNVGDVIVFLSFWVAALIGSKNGTRNGR